MLVDAAGSVVATATTVCLRHDKIMHAAKCSAKLFIVPLACLQVMLQLGGCVAVHTTSLLVQISALVCPSLTA